MDIIIWYGPFSQKKIICLKLERLYQKKNYYEFCSTIFFDYYKPYFEEIFKIIKVNPSISLQDLMSEIKRKHDNRDVLFVTDSDSRYVSSWLNMFRDDFGFVNYQPRKNYRTIN